MSWLDTLRKKWRPEKPEPQEAPAPSGRDPEQPTRVIGTGNPVQRQAGEPTATRVLTAPTPPPAQDADPSVGLNEAQTLVTRVFAPPPVPPSASPSLPDELHDAPTWAGTQIEAPDAGSSSEPDPLPGLPPQPSQAAATQILERVGTDETESEPVGAEAAAAPRADGRPSVPGVLVGVSGPLRGQIFALRDGENRLGRDPQRCQVVFTQEDLRISREHALIRHHAGTFTLSPLSERNTTRLDGDRIVGPSALRDGGRLGIGRSELVFRTIPDR
ncbi:MAG: FHA domain-containing protein [Proteobacteria bacterium]|nr:FHA domain-containing protein [Pseudomonadota bacterium]